MERIDLEAIISGGTGEVGRILVRLLLDSGLYSKVLVLTRTKKDPEFWEATNTDALEQQIIDYENVPDFPKYNHAFCCLGASKGRSGADGFVKVDYTYITTFASKIKEGGTENFSLCSSMGAAPPVKQSFYYLTTIVLLNP